MPEPLVDLTAFQRDVLVVIARNEQMNGLGIADRLEDAGYEAVNYGRLYPALDDLAEKGLIAKEKADGRSNAYSLAARGDRELELHIQWVRSGEQDESNDAIESLFQ